MADALVVGLAKKVKPKKSDAEGEASDDGEEMSLDGAEDDAVDEMLGALAREKPDREAFKSGLRDFVRACIERQEGGG